LLANSILGAGTVIAGGAVRHSILFALVHVEASASIEDSILFEGVTVGEGARLRRCIVDKDVQVPRGAQIGIHRDDDRRRFTVSEREVVVVPKGYRFDASAV